MFTYLISSFFCCKSKGKLHAGQPQSNFHLWDNNCLRWLDGENVF